MDSVHMQGIMKYVGYQLKIKEKAATENRCIMPS